MDFGDLIDMDFGGGDFNWDDILDGASQVGAGAGDAAQDVAGQLGGYGGGGGNYISPEMDFFSEYGGQFLPGGDQMAESPMSITAQGQAPASGMATGNTSLSPSGTPFGMDDEQPSFMDKAKQAGRGAMNVGQSAMRNPMVQKAAPAAIGLAGMGLNKLMQPSAQAPQQMGMPMPSRPGMMPTAAPYTDLPGTKASPNITQAPNKVKLSQGLSTRKPGYGGMSIY